MFPALCPDRREDVVLLQQWLADTMQLLSAQFPAGTVDSTPQVLCVGTCLTLNLTLTAHSIIIDTRPCPWMLPLTDLSTRLFVPDTRAHCDY